MTVFQDLLVSYINLDNVVLLQEWTNGSMEQNSQEIDSHLNTHLIFFNKALLLLLLSHFSRV